MKKFELSISVDYVKHWGVWEAIRELWQNALDHNNYTYTWTKRDLANEKNILKIISKDVALEKEMLLLGKTTKSNDKTTIGMYGEGFKLALLVLCRMGKEVTIYNACCNEIWRPHIVKSKKYNADILTIFVEKHIFNDLFDDDLTFEIKGLTSLEWEEISDKNLHIDNKLNECNKLETQYGDVLLFNSNKDKASDQYESIFNKPCVFVNGLFVSHIPVEGYRYSYNIKPKYITLDRDRGCVKGFDFKWLTSQMWSTLFNIKSQIIIKMIEMKIPDVSFIDVHIKQFPDACDSVAKEFLRKYGDDAIAINNNNEFNTVKHLYGSHAEPIIVNNIHKEILNSTSIYNESINNISKRKQSISKKTPREYINELFCDYQQNNLINKKILSITIKEFEDYHKHYEKMIKEFNKLIGMSKEWNWK